MVHLEIKNVGPIKNISLELKRYNIFIGKQSSGKSTIAKIISNCFWIEKEILTHPNRKSDSASFKDEFLYGLIDFHFMHGYFSNSSYIKYESDYISIEYNNSNPIINIKAMQTYQRCKVLYIPAERNIATKKISQTQNNNLRSFSIDFATARDFYNGKNRLKLFNLGIEFYQEIKNGEILNKIKNTEDTYNIQIDDASSGLQSVVPIAITVDFFTKLFFDKNNESKTLDQWQDRDRKNVKNFLIETNEQNEVTDNLIIRLLTTHRTNFVIEEPELNLFPQTQKDLIYYLITCSKRDNRKHSLTITTHSPYILSSLNILIFAGKLMEKGYSEEIKNITDGAYILPKDIGVYSIENGIISNIIDNNTEMISQNFLDSVADEMSYNFNNLYNLYINYKNNGRF